MTTIAALERNGSVYLAADAHSVSGCDRIYREQRKITTVTVGLQRSAQQAVFATAGLSTLRAGFRRGVKWASDDVWTTSTTDLDEWAQDRADDLSRIAHDDNTPPMVSSNTGHIDGCVVLAHRGRVFYLTDGVVTTGEHFVTAGSGEDLALGALVAMLDDETLEPETIVARAVDVAGRYDSGTGPVGQVVWLDTTGKARELDVATALAQHT